MMGTDDPRWMLNYLQAQRFARIKRAGGLTPVDPVFPAKDFYFNDFTGIADATTLRSLTGWSAYNEGALVHGSRAPSRVQSGAIARTAGNED